MNHSAPLAAGSGGDRTPSSGRGQPIKSAPLSLFAAVPATGPFLPTHQTPPFPSSQALDPLLVCLAKWKRSGTAAQSLWPIMTQQASAVVSKAAGDEDGGVGAGPSGSRGSASCGSVQLPAHRALMVVLTRVMLLGDEVQGSPHRAASPAAWRAARAYLRLLSLGGAGAYGFLQPAIVGTLLANIRAWCRNSAVYRPGGGGGGSNEWASGADDPAPKKASSHKRRRRGRGGGNHDESESEGEEELEDVGGGDGEDMSPGGGGAERNSRQASGRRGARGRPGRRAGGGSGGSGKAGGGRGGGVSVAGGVVECLSLIKACLANVPLASHQVRFRFIDRVPGSHCASRFGWGR